MKIEVRNVKIAAFASRETTCFSANIYLDGVKAGCASNDGGGGCNEYQPRSLARRLNDYASTLPPIVLDWLEPQADGTHPTIQPNADTLVGDALAAYQSARDLRRLLRERLVFTVAGKPGIYSTRKLGAAGVAALLGDPRKLAQLNAGTVLNSLAFDAALALYLAPQPEKLPMSPNQRKERP